MSLQVKHCCNSDVFHVFHILVVNWVRADVDALVFHLVDVEILEEVGVCFLNAAIDNPVVASQVRLISCSVSNNRVCLKLAPVMLLIRMVDIDDSLRVSFSLIRSSWSFAGMESVAILNSKRLAFQISSSVVEFNRSVVWHDFLTVLLVQP